MPPRTKLSIGASAASKLFSLLITVVLAVISLATALVAYGFLASPQRETISSTVDKVASERLTSKLDTVGVVGAVIGGVVAVFVLWLALFVLMRAFRRGAWLEGSVLHVRGAVRRKAANLAAGRVSLRGQTLVAEGIAIPLTLPQDELLMLANAISNTRSESDAGTAVAERLRAMARDPFS